MRQFPVKFDLQYGQGSCYGAEEEQAVIEVLRAGAPSCGPWVARFEEAFARYCGVEHALAVSSGTAALRLAMAALDVGPGDEVITTSLSWISTANAPALAGAKVVFADVDPQRFTLDPASVESKITARTKAIIVVHLYGQCADMDPLLALARRHGVALVEDCAHAPGAEYKGRKAGSMGDFGTFSFGVQKNMTTLGEGGMVVTQDAARAERIRSLRWLCTHGYDPQGRYVQIPADAMGKQYWRLEFDEVGFNLRMSDMQAAAGLVQLRKLDSLNARRIEIARRYTEGLSGVPGIVTPFEAPDGKHVYHVYGTLADRKEDLMWDLWEQKGIKCWSHYMPIHLTEAYRKLGHGLGECPVLEELSGKYVSLPLHPRLTDEAVEYLIASVRELAGARSRGFSEGEFGDARH
ncbi:MAG: DegT/DnrJ/EryC1/StrS family aminotransferase [Bryobacteraceae bacterium]